MRRIQVVLALLAVMVAMLVVFSGTALADNNRNDRFDNRVVQHDFEQEADSGDVDQSFTVTGSGDSSNQTVGITGVANTGNAQNQIGFGGDGFFCDEFFCNRRDFCDDFDLDGFCDGGFIFGDDFIFGDFDGDGFEDVGADINVSGSTEVVSDQEVNEAAAAG